MDTKEEIKQIAYDFTTSKGDCKKLENRILSLFGVVKSDSELLPKRLSNEAYKKAQVMSYAGFLEWWDEQQV